MNAKEGVTRIAKLISVIGWLMLFGFIVGAISNLAGRPDGGMSLFFLLCAFVVFALFQGIVWIFDGFVGNKKQDSALLWPYKRRIKQVDQSEALSDAHKRVAANLRLRGVHGWLLWLVIVLMIISPLSNLGQLSINLEKALKANPNLAALPAWGNYETSAWMLGWLAAAASFFAGYRLLKHHSPQSVQITIIILWCAPILTLIADMYFTSYFFNISLSSVLDAGVFRDLFKGLAAASIWTLYLKLSRRVKNTYYAGFQNGEAGEPVRSEPTL